MLSPPIERASTPHRRGISEVTPRPEREEEDRQTRPTQKADLAGETGTQGADAVAAIPSLSAVEEDVLSALMNLGYQRPAAEKAVTTFARNGKGGSFEEMFRGALGALSK